MRSHSGATARSRNWRPLRVILWSFTIATAFPAVSEAQNKGDHIPGFLGLSSGTQAPPGLYLDNLVWVYPTSTIKDNAGHDINLPGSLTSTAGSIPTAPTKLTDSIAH